MRRLSMLLLLGILRVAVAQSETPPPAQKSLFASLVPDATISIRKHPMGADMVDITMKAAGYPPKLLDAQLKALGTFLGSQPRGVQIGDVILDETNPNSKFLKASFAVDGVIDRKVGSVRLRPFVQAFAGAAKPWTINSVEFQFQGEVPTEKMLQYFRSKGEIVEGKFENTKDARTAGIEFRVQLLSQDPAKIDIPEPGDNPAPPIKKPVPPPGMDWTTIIVFIVAAGAVGALVYSLLLRGRPKGRF